MMVRSASESSRIALTLAIAIGVAMGVVMTGTPERSASLTSSTGAANPPVTMTAGIGCAKVSRSAPARAAGARPSRKRTSLSPKMRMRPAAR